MSLRLLLLKVFGAMCGLEAPLISTLLNSILPMELARDLQTDTQGENPVAEVCTYHSIAFSLLSGVMRTVNCVYWVILHEIIDSYYRSDYNKYNNPTLYDMEKCRKSNSFEEVLYI